MHIGEDALFDTLLFFLMQSLIHQLHLEVIIEINYLQPLADSVRIFISRHFCVLAHDPCDVASVILKSGHSSLPVITSKRRHCLRFSID